MHAQISKYWYAVRYSYWFLPSLMALAAILLSSLTYMIDVAVGGRWWKSVLLFGLNTPDGARALLSTIAGSIITVAGVSFSITIAAVVFATGQLGPRLLANFMGDRGNQITFGTFIATFLYCLLVLRTVLGVGEGIDREPFVPHLGIMVALLLTLASLGVLISFIHHVPRSISASQVVAQLGADLNLRITRLFPASLGDTPGNTGADLADIAADVPADAGRPILATGDGYITQVDLPGLLREATARQCVLWLRRRPGDFVACGQTLATAHGGEPDGALQRLVVMAIALGSERTNQQDLLFVVQQLVEVAIRALSPGINDPFTAISVLDRLGSGAINLGWREMPSRFRRDAEGALRLVVPDLGYAEIVGAMFDRMRPYAASDRNAALHMMATLETAAGAVTHQPYRAALLEQAAALNDAAQASLPLERDRTAMQAAYARLFDRLPG